MGSVWYGAVIATIIFICWIIKSFFRQRKLPHGPIPFPLIGNVLLQKDFLQWLNRLGQSYGPVFTVWCGRKPIVIVTDYYVALEVFNKNGIKFAARPHFLNKLLTSNRQRMPFMDYSPDFVKKQRICVAACQLDKQHMEDSVESEVLNLCQELCYQVTAKEFDPANYFEDFVLNLMMKLVYGVTVDVSFAQFNLPGKTDLLTLANTTNLFWWLRLLKYKKYQDYQTFMIIRENILLQLFEKSGTIKCNKALASNILNAVNDEFKSECFSEANMLCSDLFVVSIENLAAAMKWLLLYLITWPEIQTTVQDKLDSKFEKGKHISVEDAMNIPYLQASVYEILRLSSINPLGALHLCTEPVTLRGYKLPKKTCVCVNLGMIHLSNKYWENPFEFNPCRFLELKNDLWVLRDVANMKGFLAFGSGVRRCIGDDLAMKVLVTTMANLLSNFSFEIPPSSMKPDLSGMTTLISVPRPYSVSITQRISL